MRSNAALSQSVPQGRGEGGKAKRINMADIAAELLVMKDMLVNLDHILRGNNGYKGVLALMAAQDERMTYLERSMEKISTDLDDVKPLLAAMKSCQDSNNVTPHEARLAEEDSVEADDRFVSWRELRKNLFWPVLVMLLFSSIGFVGLLVVLLSEHSLIP